jgi:hypothetical protein
MHDPGHLGVQELPSPLDGPDVDASGDHGSGTTPRSGHQRMRQVHDEAVHGQRFLGERPGTAGSSIASHATVEIGPRRMSR